MFKGAARFWNEFNDIILKGVRGYKLNFFALIGTFVLLNTLSGIMLNIYMENENLKDRYKMSIYFKGGPSEEILNAFEKKLLNLDEVRSVKYESREVALRELEGELGIRISKGNNPLSSNFLVNFYRGSDLEVLQSKLDSEDIIKEIYIDEEQLLRLDGSIAKNNKVISGILIGGVIPLILIIFSFFHGNIVNNTRDIATKVYMGEKKNNAVAPYYLVSDCIFISASIIGTLLFINLYEIFRGGFYSIKTDIILASTNEIVIVAIGVTLVTTLIFPILSRIIYKVDGE